MSESRNNLYARAGIEDVTAFYAALPVSAEPLNAENFDAVNRFDIRWARPLWVFDNVRRGARVLDLGCGSGILALLKKKAVELVGVDLAPACAAQAARNGYDATHAAPLTALPFPAASFDYVVSLDVFGHIEFSDKDPVLAEIKRVLKPGGVTLHGIEALDRARHKDYEQMTDEELRRYVGVDGHVGMEDENEMRARFQKFFAFVETRPRFAVTWNCEELIKQSDAYGTPLCDEDFTEYLRTLSHDERRAFDMAMGFAFQRISQLNLRLPQSEYVLLKASDNSLGDFYNEYAADRALLFPQGGKSNTVTPLDLMNTDHAAFDTGWHQFEDFPPRARWMRRRGKIRFHASSLKAVQLQIISHLPDIATRPLELEFYLNGKLLTRYALTHNDWQTLELTAAHIAPADCGLRIADRGTEAVSEPPAVAGGSRAQPSDLNLNYKLEIHAARTWQPCEYHADSTDDRELSIALAGLNIS